LNRPVAYQIRAEDLQGTQVAPVVVPGFAGAAAQGRF
jgi:hypothetical protein